MKYLNITGANGKGPVAIKTAKFRKKTGIYISPHLFSLRERVQVNVQKIRRENI